MWRHGIHAFLECLRHRPPESLEHILAFLYIGAFLAVPNIAALFIPSTLRGENRLILHYALPPDISLDCNHWHTGDLSPSRNPNASQVWSEPLTRKMYHSTIIVYEGVNLIASNFKRGRTEIHRGCSDLLLVHPILLHVLTWCILSIPSAYKLFEEAIPWTAICDNLNQLKKQQSFWTQLFTFLLGEYIHNPPLPEDYTIRGQLYTKLYFPEKLFRNEEVDDEERMLDKPSNDAHRIVRALWLARDTSSAGNWIQNNRATQAFTEDGVLNQRKRPTKWANTHKPYVNSITSSIQQRGAAKQTSAVELRFWRNIKSSSLRLAQRFLRPGSLSARLILQASFFHNTIALPTSLNTSTATEDGNLASSTLYTDTASLILILLVLGVAELLIRFKRMGAVPVYGTLMSTMAFGWWCCRNDATTSYMLLWKCVYLRCHCNLTH